MPFGPTPDLHPTIGIQVHSAIQRFRDAHKDDEDFATSFNQHIMQKLDIALKQVVRLNTKLWFTERERSIARAQQRKANLIQQRDAITIQILERQVEFLRCDAGLKDELRTILASGRTLQRNDVPDILPEHRSHLRALQTRFNDLRCIFENMILHNATMWNADYMKLAQRRLAVDAERTELLRTLETLPAVDPSLLRSIDQAANTQHANNSNATLAEEGTKLDESDEKEQVKESDHITKESVKDGENRLTEAVPSRSPLDSSEHQIVTEAVATPETPETNTVLLHRGDTHHAGPFHNILVDASDMPKEAGNQSIDKLNKKRRDAGEEPKYDDKPLAEGDSPANAPPVKRPARRPAKRPAKRQRKFSDES